jgi:hypothetical protein
MTERSIQWGAPFGQLVDIYSTPLQCRRAGRTPIFPKPTATNAWLNKNRCCERIIAKADQEEQDSLLALLTVGGVYVEEQAQKFVDFHFCRNWHRRSGKHVFIRNLDDGLQVLRRSSKRGTLWNRAFFSADVPIPSRHPAGNGGGFSPFTTFSDTPQSAVGT